MAAAEPRIAIPLRTRAEKRGAERFDVSMPVQVEGHDGTTCDLSASGLSFDSDQAYAAGERIHIVIEYLLDGHNYPLKCEAEVVRCEREGDRFVVGARLLAPLTEGPYDQLP